MAENSGSSFYVTTSSASSSTDASPTVALLYVLIQTFSALGLGWISVQAGFIDLQKGHLRALEFFIGRVALPLLVFKVIATADLGDVHWELVAACCLGKLFVYIITFIVTYCGYKADRSRSQRILTANIFGFFTTASNDFAIGFPVIHALYGDGMAVYIAANVFVFQICFQPLSMVIFEMGKALHGVGDHEVLSRAQRCTSFSAKMLKGIFQNLIIIGTLLGLLFQLTLKDTLISQNGKKQLPHPWGDMIELWTSPFTMMFLFLNGASLTSARIAFWPILLTLMKVVVCAYVSFYLATQLVSPHSSQERELLEDYAFFYGTIPAGGTPLVFAQQYDPAVVGLVASASLFGLILAGPVEFMTAVFMGTGSSNVMYISLHQVCQVTSSLSIACSAVFLIYAGVSWCHWHYPERVIGLYGLVVFLYSVLANLMSQPWLKVKSNFGLVVLFSFLQNLSYFLVMYLALMLMSKWLTIRCAHPVVLTLIVVVAAIVPFVSTYPNSLHEVVLEQDWATHTSAVILAIWNGFLFALTASIIAWGVLRKRIILRSTNSTEVQQGSLLQQRRLSSPRASSIVSPLSSPTWSLAVPLLDNGYSGLVTTLVILQTVRLLMETVNAAAFATADKRGAGGFTPMFILVNILEHGQGCFLLLALVFQRQFHISVCALFSRMRACGCVFHGLPEFGSIPEVVDSFTSPFTIAGQVPTEEGESSIEPVDMHIA